MRYVRTFHIQAAHFNNEKAYATAWALVGAKGGLVIVDVLNALRDVHGHNFKIVVACDGAGPDASGKPWLIDDEQLTHVVMNWDNVNLSMHRDFIEDRCRATTEAMAERLLAKLRGVFGQTLIASVTVHETENIYAHAH